MQVVYSGGSSTPSPSPRLQRKTGYGRPVMPGYMTHVHPQILVQRSREKLTEGDITLRDSIPAMSKCVASLCLILNIILPGFGTLTAGLSVLCCSTVRPKGDSKGHCIWVNAGVALLQFVLTFLCLLGWIWSIMWGVAFLSVSRQYYYKRQDDDKRRDPEKPHSKMHTLPKPHQSPAGSSRSSNCSNKKNGGSHQSENQQQQYQQRQHYHYDRYHEHNQRHDESELYSQDNDHFETNAELINEIASQPSASVPPKENSNKLLPPSSSTAQPSTSGQSTSMATDVSSELYPHCGQNSSKSEDCLDEISNNKPHVNGQANVSINSQSNNLNSNGYAKNMSTDFDTMPSQPIIALQRASESSALPGADQGTISSPHPESTIMQARTRHQKMLQRKMSDNDLSPFVLTHQQLEAIVIHDMPIRTPIPRSEQSAEGIIEVLPKP